MGDWGGLPPSRYRLDSQMDKAMSIVERTDGWGDLDDRTRQDNVRLEGTFVKRGQRNPTETTDIFDHLSGVLFG